VLSFALFATALARRVCSGSVEGFALWNGKKTCVFERERGCASCHVEIGPMCRRAWVNSMRSGPFSVKLGRACSLEPSAFDYVVNLLELLREHWSRLLPSFVMILTFIAPLLSHTRRPFTSLFRARSCVSCLWRPSPALSTKQRCFY